jgi:hypothetical protein
MGKPWLLLLLLFSGTAHAGAYEWFSEKAYMFRHGTCPAVPASVDGKLMPALEPACAAGFDAQMVRFTNETASFADALFFEGARQELFEQAVCNEQKVTAVLKTPAAFQVYLETLRKKVPELKKLSKEGNDLRGTIGALTENIPPAPPIELDEEGKELPRPEDPYASARESIAESEKRLKKVKAAYEALLGTIPFSSYSAVHHAIEALPDPNKDPEAFEKKVFRLLQALGKRLPEQAKLVRPGQTLSITAQEDAVQDEDFLSLVLDKYPLSKEEKKAFACRLDARYGKGRSDLDNALIWGSVPLMWESKAITVPLQGLRALSAMEKLKAIGSVAARASKWVAGGVLAVDSMRDIERFCLLSSPDHFSSSEENEHGKPGCGADDVVEELYERDCASYFVFWGLALNSSRTAQKVLGSELIRKADSLGIKTSDKAFQAGVTRDMLEMYVLPDEEEAAKKAAKAGTKKLIDARTPVQAGPAAERAGGEVKALNAPDKNEKSDEKEEDEED